MKTIVKTMAIAILMSGAVAQAQQKNAAIFPVDSASALETRVADVLRSSLNLNPTLEAVEGREGDVRVRTLLAVDKKDGAPRIATYVDTRVLGLKDGKPLAQVISFYSAADIKLKTGDRLALLEWANSWNRHGVPVRVHLTSAELFISTDLMLTPLLPVSDAHVLYAYATVTRSWKAVIDSLQQAGLLELG